MPSHIIRYILILLFVAQTATAQTFFTLSTDEVAVDSVLPVWTYSCDVPLEAEADDYAVSLLYPEFIDMQPHDVRRYRDIAGDAPLPEMPLLTTYVARARDKAKLYVEMVPLACRGGRLQKLVGFMLSIGAPYADSTVLRARQMQRTEATAATYAEHSLLATGRWAKISVPETGIYHLSDALLKRAGFSDPSRVKIYGYGGALQPERLTQSYLAETDDLKEVATCTVGGRRLFRGIGPVSWNDNSSTQRTRNPYSTYGAYFITDGIDGEPLTADSATFVGAFYPAPDDYHSLSETDNYAWFAGGRNLFDRQLLSEGQPYRYALAAQPGSKGTLTVAITWNAYCQVKVAVNDSIVGTISFQAPQSIEDHSVAAERFFTYNLPELRADNTVTLTKTSGGDVRLDYVQLRMDTPKDAPQLSQTWPEPTLLYNITNQDHHADSTVDMVIIIPTSQRLRQQAERIKQMHEEMDSMTVRIVPADELFNEFSSGTPDANAYRRYLKMLYDRSTAAGQAAPRHLLLFGDGAWDNRMLAGEWTGYSPDDFLLCYESENSFSETNCYVADDYFTLLDDGEGDALLTRDKRDMAVGRISARTADEAKIMVDKIIAYRKGEHAGAWQNTLCFMGDDGNYNAHMRDIEAVVSEVQRYHQGYNIKKIYWDAYTRTTSTTGNSYPDATRLIKQQMQTGALVMDYAGHGAPYMMSHEGVLHIEDFAESAQSRLPLWITASCDIMPFDGQTDNIGETAMLNPTGGAVAFYGTTRTVYSTQNRLMNCAFIRHVLGYTDGRRNTMGEAAMLAKNEMVTRSQDLSANKMQFTLLGDPALVLATPTGEVVVDSINGIDVSDGQTVTLTAGTTARVSGHVVGADDFRGTLTATVRDVEETIICKMNSIEETDTAYKFRDRPNTIYTGSDSIRQGRFSLEFAVPRDITYSDDCGQLTLYALANDRQQTAHGENTQFTMTAGDNAENDGQGPSVYCYLNSPDFTNGDHVNTTPYFYAELFDRDGINAAGNGIGHDIELIVDGEMSRTYNLNEYFNYDFGDYRSGSVAYSLPQLTTGNHRLVFRAWDVLNNPTTAELTFTVDEAQKPRLIQVAATNNPASTSTTFLITHNRAGCTLNIVLDVFDCSGRLLWHHTEQGTSATSTYTIPWDLTVDGGRRLNTGVYLYRAGISCDGSKYDSEAQKLIVLYK